MHFPASLFDGLFTKKRHFIVLATSVTLLVCSIGYLYYSHTLDKLRLEKEHELEAIAKLKINQLEMWFASRQSDGKVISESPLFSQAVQNWIENNSNKTLEAGIKKRLQLAQEVFKYESVVIASVDGKVLMSTGLPIDELFGLAKSKVLESVATARFAFTDLYNCPNHQSIHLDFVTPIKNTNDQTIAVLVARVNPEDFLFPMVQSWPTLSNTSETLLIRQEGDSILYHNELKHQLNTALRLRLPLTRTDLPAVQAALGKIGVFQGTDYRGIKVLAYISPVKNTPWFMVAKVDRAEIFSALFSFSMFVFIVILLLIVSLTVFIMWVYHYRQRNSFRKQWLAQEELRTMLHSIGDAVISVDRHGLIRYINKIAEQLTGWSEKNAIGIDSTMVFNIVNEDTQVRVENPVDTLLKGQEYVQLGNNILLVAKDGSQTPITGSVAHIKSETGQVIGAVFVFKSQVEERIQQNILNARLRLFEFAAEHSTSEILTKTLDEVEKLTDSKIGFYHYVMPNQETLSLQAWSTNTEKYFCKAENKKNIHYAVSMAGVWTDCIIQKKPVIHNDYASLTHKKGMPEGHARVVRELVVPIQRNNKIVAVLGVGNKPTNYDEKDIEIVAFIADVVWEIVQKKRIEDEVKEANRELVETQTIANLGSFSWNLETNIWSSTKILDAIFGINETYSRTLQGWANLIHPEFQAQMTQYVLEEVVGKRQKFDKEYKIIRQNDACERWVHGLGELELDENNVPLKLIGTIVDITERKIAQAELQKSKDELYSLLEDDISADIITNPEGELIYCNATYLEMFGFKSFEEAVACPVEQLYVDASQRHHFIALLEKHKRLELIEDELITINGKRITTLENSIGVFDETGKLVQIRSYLVDITERKKAENALRESERVLSTLVDNLPGMAYRTAFDRDWTALFLSQSCYAITGYHPEDFIQNKTVSFNDIIVSEFREPILEHWNNMLANKQPFTYEYQIQKADGEIVWVWERGQGIFDENGNVIYLEGYIEDINKRKQNETKLKSLTSIIEQSLNEVYVFDAQTFKFVYANESALANLGYTIEEIVNQTPYDIKPGFTGETFIHGLQPLITGEVETLNFETNHQRKNGTLYPVDVFLQRSVFEGKQVFVAMVLDVSELKKQQEALKISEENYKKLIENMPDGVYKTTHEGSVVDVNPAMLSILGFDSKEELMGINIAEELYFDASEREKMTIEGMNSKLISYRLRKKDGSELWVEDHGWYTYNDKGEIIYHEGVIRDISERRKAEEQLRLSEEKNRTILRAIPDLLFVMSKDGYFIDYHATDEHLLYIQPDKFLGKNIKDVLPHQVCDDLFAHLDLVFEGTGVHLFQYSLDMPTGKAYFEANITAFQDDKVLILARNITGRKQAEEKLRKSEENLFITLNSIGDGVMSTDINGLITNMNPVAEKLCGWNLNDALGMPLTSVFNIINSETRQKAVNPVDQVLEKGEIVGMANHTILISKTGLEYQIADSAAPIKNNEGQILGVVMVFSDVTEKYAASAALRESESRMQAFFSQSLDGFFFMMLDEPVEWNDSVDKEKALDYIFEHQHMTKANQAMLDQYGAIEEQFIGATPNQLFAHDIEAGRATWRDFFDNGKLHIDTNEKKFDGTDMIIEGDYLCLYDSFNRITGHFGIQRDVTEYRKANERLKAASEHWSKTFDAIHDIIILLDANQKIIQANKAFLTFAQTASVDELKSIFCFNNVHHTNCPIEKCPYIRSQISKQRETMELEINGLIYEILVDPIIDENNNLVGAVHIMSDITERKYSENLLQEKSEEIEVQNEELLQANLELTIAKDRAQESDRLKSAFLANMSHEIRTPMNGILGFAELLKEPELSGDQQQEYIKIIEKSGARMLNIINDIVDISRIEAGLMQISLKETNINEHIDYIHTFFKPEAAAKGIELLIVKPLEKKEALITTDSEKLYAILINLVKNAIKYTQKGTIELGYRLKYTPNDSESAGTSTLEFYVKDTGMGIPQNRQKAIFERFIQADIEDKMALQGAGLGLAITKSYVEMLDGDIWVESENGNGSTFYFTLPYNTKLKPTSAGKHEFIPNAMNDFVSRDLALKVLIVEDDETSMELISLMLKKHCKEILMAQTGLEAIDICRNNADINLVLMDIQMPKMSGYEATQLIRTFNKDVIIIAQTAFGLSGDKEKAINAGCNDYISKPINKNKLIDLIKKYVEP